MTGQAWPCTLRTPRALAWRFLSYAGRADELQWSGEGPNESTLVLLADGKSLLCIMRCALAPRPRLPILSPPEGLAAARRMDAGDGHSSGKPYAKRTSTDSGRTWSPLVNMSAGIGTAKPRATRLGSAIVLVGGRPGNVAWLNAAGDGEAWRRGNQK